MALPSTIHIGGAKSFAPATTGLGSVEDTTLRPQERRQGPRRCYTCGNQGHLSWACPKGGKKGGRKGSGKGSKGKGGRADNDDVLSDDEQRDFTWTSDVDTIIRMFENPWRSLEGGSEFTVGGFSRDKARAAPDHVVAEERRSEPEGSSDEGDEEYGTSAGSRANKTDRDASGPAPQEERQNLSMPPPSMGAGEGKTKGKSLTSLLPAAKGGQSGGELAFDLPMPTDDKKKKKAKREAGAALEIDPPKKKKKKKAKGAVAPKQEDDEATAATDGLDSFLDSLAPPHTSATAISEDRAKEIEADVNMGVDKPTGVGKANPPPTSGEGDDDDSSEGFGVFEDIGE